MSQEKNLQMERPGAHIRIKIREIGIICHRFISSPPAQARADPFCQRCLSNADISCYNNEMLGHMSLRVRKCYREYRRSKQICRARADAIESIIFADKMSTMHRHTTLEQANFMTKYRIRDASGWTIFVFGVLALLLG